MDYTFSNKTFSAIAKDDVKDKIKVEIGDSKQKDRFYPQVKIMRWDNECNVSLRLKDDKVATESYKTKDGKIVWTKGNTEVEFYDLPKSKDLPEGGYEFNIILKEKPDTNVIEFTLEDKDVDYCYQPELEDWEVEDYARMANISLLEAKRIARPAKVVGSYSVYANVPKINRIGGKDYKIGKIGHIYRPLLEDAIGKQVWGDLEIKNKKLTVTIPQDFLDNAIYPVSHAAGLEFGFHNDGASTTGDNFQDQAFSYINWDLYGGTSCTGADGTTTNISARLIPFSSSYYGDLKICLWLDASPQTLVGASSVVTTDSTSAKWYTGTLSVDIDAIEYCLGCVADKYTNIRYDSATGQGLAGKVASTYPNVPNPLGVTHNLNRRYCIYVTYTEPVSGPTGIKTINETAIANVKTINGTAIASVKTING